MDIGKRFDEILQHVKHPSELRLNNMLDPFVLGYQEDDQSSEILFCTQEWEKNQRDEIHGGAIASMFDTAMGVIRGRIPGDRKRFDRGSAGEFYSPVPQWRVYFFHADYKPWKDADSNHMRCQRKAERKNCGNCFGYLRTV